MIKKTLLVFVGVHLLVFLGLAIGSVSAQSLVNINTANSAELQSLPGIGEVIAGRIIEYRQLQGPFQSVADIENVSGIGPGTLANIQDFITVTGSVEEPQNDEPDPTGESTTDNLININTAGVDDLQSLPGVGPSRAGDIVSYREEFGSFTSTEEIKNVPGIGPTTFDGFKDLITVNGSPVASETEDGNGDTNGDADKEVFLSTHRSPAVIQIREPAPVIRVSAGRDRLTTTGSVLSFEIDLDEAYSGSVRVEWSMGDGALLVGQRIEHGYLFPGTYVVVVTVTAGDGNEAVGRLQVEVIEPELKLVSVDEDSFTFSNESNREINLYRWSLETEGDSFSFQSDVIILPNQELTLSARVIDLEVEGQVDLLSPLGDQIDSFEVLTGVDRQEDLREELSRARDKLLALETEYLFEPEVVEQTPESFALPAEPEPATESVSLELAEADQPVEAEVSADNSEADDLLTFDRQVVYQGQDRGGIFGDLLSWPARLVDAVRATVVSPVR